jgi:outer membrane immunogenic protein
MHKFRAQLLATTAMLALSGAAYAADMPVKAPPPVAPVAPVTNWTGFYVGAQVGGATFDPSCHTSATFPLGDLYSAMPCDGPGFLGGPVITNSAETSSFAGGGKIGYDYQFWDHAVLGVVGDFDWVHLNSTVTTTSPSDVGFPFIVGLRATGSANENIDWLASARGRVGWAFDQVLFYATGGVAWTRIKASASFSGPTCCGGTWATPVLTTTKTGVVAGGGFEYRLTQNLSVVGELLWYGFGSTSVSGTGNGITYTTSFNNNDVLVGTIGANWRF